MLNDLTEEQRLYLDLRDIRVLALDKAMVIEQEIAESSTLAAILEAIGDDSEAAMLEFATVNPADHRAVAALQARVFCLTYFRQTINTIRQTAATAGVALDEELTYRNEQYDE